MTIELKMPALSPTMEKGTLAKWLVEEGDAVEPGALLAEIETDKATLELEAADAGVITSIIVPEGTCDVAVGTVIALIGASGEAIAPRTLKTAGAKSAATLRAPIAPPPEPVVDVEVATPEPEYVAMVEKNGVNATPLARRLAKLKGVSLSGITGTGALGRIVKGDLGVATLIAAAQPVAATPAVLATPATPATAASHGAPAGVPMETAKLSGMRKTIARRLTDSKQTVPHFYLTAHCCIDHLLTLRHELNANLANRGVKLSVNDLVIKAMALAMEREPDTNVQFAGDEMYRFARVDIAMAVAIEGGLVTPVIRDVVTLSLAAVAEQTKALALRAREGRLMPEEYQGGTASISNLGMYGIDEMIPVINPPQALILGIGSGIEKPWRVGSGIALATLMTATASFDHRAIDGAAAARFMAALRDLIEQPLQIIC